MPFHPRLADPAARSLAGLLALAIWISSFGVSAASAAGSALGKASAQASAPVSISLPSLGTVRPPATNAAVSPVSVAREIPFFSPRFRSLLGPAAAVTVPAAKPQKRRRALPAPE